MAVHFLVGNVVGLITGILVVIGAAVRGAQPDDALARAVRRPVHRLHRGALGATAMHVLAEWLHGSTIGKRLCGITVIHEDGGPASFAGVVRRNVAYLLDAMFFGFVAYHKITQSPRSQRVGDQWGRTMVVRIPSSIRRIVVPDYDSSAPLGGSRGGRPDQCFSSLPPGSSREGVAGGSAHGGSQSLDRQRSSGSRGRGLLHPRHRCPMAGDAARHVGLAGSRQRVADPEHHLQLRPVQLRGGGARARRQPPRLRVRGGGVCDGPWHDRRAVRGRRGNRWRSPRAWTSRPPSLYAAGCA